MADPIRTRPCPMALSACTPEADCPWYMDGKCAVAVIAENSAKKVVESKSGSKKRGVQGQFIKETISEPKK